MHELLRDRADSTEIIVTTVRPDHWLDLWRVELETYDVPGVLAVVFEIFQERKLKVIASEGSINTFNEVNTCAFVLSGVQYTSEYDGDTVSRSQTENCALADLELTLKLNLFNQLTLTDQGWPKIKVRRFDGFRRLAQDINPRRVRELGNAAGELMADSCLVLNNSVLQRLERWVGHSLLYTVHVDTKVRVLRVHIFEDSGPFRHIQILILRNSGACFQQIFGYIARLNGNVVKYQVRQGSNMLFETEKSCVRLDITYGPKGDVNMKPDILEEKLIECLSTGRLLSDSGIEILRSTHARQGR